MENFLLAMQEQINSENSQEARDIIKKGLSVSRKF